MEINRREFLKKAAALGLMTVGTGFIKTIPNQRGIDLVVVRNGPPTPMVRKAIGSLGGISRFVKRGDVVVVKPNMSWDRTPELAATTNPEVVAEIVRMCLEAGATQVKVFDRTCNEPRRCYRHSGIQEAVEKAGGKVFHVHRKGFKQISIPQGELLKSWKFYQDALECDVLINVPIAKHHSLARLSMGIKNLMGLLGGNRGLLHPQFDRKIVDINTVLRPHLTILDAVRILVRNGPQGGNPADVKKLDTIVVGTDPVAVDSYGATLFGLKPEDLGYIKIAHQRGLGKMDLAKLKIEIINLTQ